LAVKRRTSIATAKPRTPIAGKPKLLASEIRGWNLTAAAQAVRSLCTADRFSNTERSSLFSAHTPPGIVRLRGFLNVLCRLCHRTTFRSNKDLYRSSPLFSTSIKQYGWFGRFIRGIYGIAQQESVCLTGRASGLRRSQSPGRVEGRCRGDWRNLIAEEEIPEGRRLPSWGNCCQNPQGLVDGVAERL
jgi:hypothetical protein